jgi:nucleoside triphosphatase
MPKETQAKYLQRVIVVPIIRNAKGQVLICKKPPDRGVFSDQWGLPGGGMEPGETLETALIREAREELGIGIEEIRPLFFKDGTENKIYPDGQSQQVYMIYLLFECLAVSDEIQLNEEFVEYAWSAPSEFGNYDLNNETLETFIELGVIDDRVHRRFR